MYSDTPVHRLRGMRRIAGQLPHLLGGTLRAVADRERRGELAARLDDYVAYDALRLAIAREHRAEKPTGIGDGDVALLVTTNERLHVLAGGQWRRLFPGACFGLARQGETLFLAAAAGLHSFVLAGELRDVGDVWTLRGIRVLIRFETRYHNERLHQIAYDDTATLVRCANTRRSSILSLDPAGAQPFTEAFLFEDGTGFPMHTDQGHVNTVTPHGDALLFAMHNAGTDGSALGFLHDGRVHAYAYPARGVHDLLIHDDALMFCDSFQPNLMANDPDVSGAIRYAGEEYLQDAGDGVGRKLVLRGLAVRGEMLAVGFSHFSKRSERFDGRGGGVLLFRGGRLDAVVDGPCSQVYDVLPIDRVRGDRVGPPREPDELDRMFRRDVGPLLYDRPLPQAVGLSQLR